MYKVYRYYYFKFLNIYIHQPLSASQNIGLIPPLNRFWHTQEVNEKTVGGNNVRLGERLGVNEVYIWSLAINTYTCAYMQTICCHVSSKWLEQIVSI